MTTSNRRIPLRSPQNSRSGECGASAPSAISSIAPVAQEADLDPVTEAAREFARSISRFHAGWPAALAVAGIIGSHGDYWFGRAVEQYDKLSTLQPGSREYERHKPRDVAISVGLWWKSLSPYRITMVDASIHAYMLALDAPLPSDPCTWKKARKRILKNVYAALNPESKMSDGWRARWLARYPLTARAMAAVGFKLGKRQRANYSRAAVQSVS